VGANGCNVHHHAHFPTLTICYSLVCLPTDVPHCTGVTYDSSQGNAPGILWTEYMAQYTHRVWRQAFGLETSQTYFLHSWLAFIDNKWDQKFKSKMCNIL